MLPGENMATVVRWVLISQPFSSEVVQHDDVTCLLIAWRLQGLAADEHTVAMTITAFG